MKSLAMHFRNFDEVREGEVETGPIEYLIPEKNNQKKKSKSLAV